jgi:hypothetical protein
VLLGVATRLIPPNWNLGGCKFAVTTPVAGLPSDFHTAWARSGGSRQHGTTPAMEDKPDGRRTRPASAALHRIGTVLLRCTCLLVAPTLEPPLGSAPVLRRPAAGAIPIFGLLRGPSIECSVPG